MSAKDKAAKEKADQYFAGEIKEAQYKKLKEYVFYEDVTKIKEIIEYIKSNTGSKILFVDKSNGYMYFRKNHSFLAKMLHPDKAGKGHEKREKR